jgi:trimeric autotransporter adhesin
LHLFFNAAFGLGNDDKYIAFVDEGGVALAATQGLNQKLEDQLKKKDAEIEDLKQSMADLKSTVQSLADRK